MVTFSETFLFCIKIWNSQRDLRVKLGLFHFNNGLLHVFSNRNQLIPFKDLFTLIAINLKWSLLVQQQTHHVSALGCWTSSKWSVRMFNIVITLVFAAFSISTWVKGLLNLLLTHYSATVPFLANKVTFLRTFHWVSLLVYCVCV